MAGAFAPLRKRVIGAGLSIMRRTGLARAGAALAAGRGAILMFHHVRPFSGEPFAPNRGLEIEPHFLDSVLGLLRRRGIDIVTLDEARRRLHDKESRRFAVLTFDDGYRDNVEYALPILERHEAPFTIYVATGFADRIAQLWWVDMEMALRRLDGVAMLRKRFPLGTADEKMKAFSEIYWNLREGPEELLRAAVQELAAAAHVDSQQNVTDLCMDWNEIGRLAEHPLCTIGVHTISHPMLAKHPADLVRHELAEGRRLIETRLGCRAVHLAYPVGDAGSAGPREFAIARELGFETAVTTRKGMIFADHAAHLTALPRLSVNGEWQDPDMMDILLTGMPFLAWNRGRRVITA